MAKKKIGLKGRPVKYDYQKIILWYQNGKDPKEIAKMFKMSFVQVYNILKKNGIKLIKKSKKEAE